jgi:starch synthase
MRPTRVLFLSAEAEPFTRVGNLAEMAGDLPQALRALAPIPEKEQASPIDVRLVIPFHGQVHRSIKELHLAATFSISHASGPIPVEVFTTQYNQVPVYLIAGPPIGKDSPVYSHDPGYDSNKYIFFSLAALELCRHINWQPDIVHANDWHTAPAVYWLRLHRAQDTFFSQTRSVLTIHNLSFLGVGANFAMYAYALPPSQDSRLPDWARQLPLPLGILSADWLTTNSPSYATEILNPQQRTGLEPLLAHRANQISGILYGLDEHRWDPSNDPYIPVSYTPDSLMVREANKIALLSQVGLLTSPRENSMQNTMLIGVLGPLDYHKGTDLAIEALYQIAAQSAGYFPCEWRAIIIGTGLAELESSARALQETHPHQIRFVRRFDTPLVHQTYGASDVLLLPVRNSSYDSNALIGMRYACIPVAHAVGSLADIIQNERTGLLFERLAPDAIEKALRRSARLFNSPVEWQRIQQAAMRHDFSWRKTAAAYRTLYQTLRATPLA